MVDLSKLKFWDSGSKPPNPFTDPEAYAAFQKEQAAQRETLYASGGAIKKVSDLKKPITAKNRMIMLSVAITLILAATYFMFKRGIISI